MPNFPDPDGYISPMSKYKALHAESEKKSPYKYIDTLINVGTQLASAGLQKAAANKDKVIAGQTASMKEASGKMTMNQGISEKKQGGIGPIGQG